MKSILAAGLLMVGLSAQAQVTNTVTYFIPNPDAQAPKDSGLFIQLDPDGTFTTLELLSAEPASCTGKYKLTDLSMVLNLDKCGGMVMGPGGDVMMIDGQNTNILISVKVEVPNVFISFPLTMNENGFSSDMKMTTATMGKNANSVNTLGSQIFGAPGKIVEVANYFFAPKEEAAPPAEVTPAPAPAVEAADTPGVDEPIAPTTQKPSPKTKIKKNKKG